MLNDIRHKEIFCVYFHLYPTTKDVFYIGIGKPTRPHSRMYRSDLWKKTVAKYGYEVLIVHTEIDWATACMYEKLYIKAFGRIDKDTGQLVNHTDGGDGAIGQVGYWKGKKRPELGLNNKLYPRRSWVGRKHTEESKRKMSLSQMGKPGYNKGVKGKPWTDEMRAKRVQWLTGRKHSEETKLKMSLASKGKPKNYKTWNAGKKGLYKASAESLLKMSQASKLSWIKRKQKIAV